MSGTLPQQYGAAECSPVQENALSRSFYDDDSIHGECSSSAVAKNAMPQDIDWCSTAPVHAAARST